MFFGMFELLKDVLVFLGYVSSGSSFPQPLNEQEEQECLDKMAEGDIDAKNMLIEHNLRLVAHIAKKYAGSGIDQDDLISIGTIGLIKGIASYNPDKKTRLVSYAARCIENEILMKIRSMKKQSKEISLDGPIGTDKNGNAITLNDILGVSEESVTDQVEMRMQIQRLSKMMSAALLPREQQVVGMRFGLQGQPPMTQNQIAKILGISRSYVSRIEKNALNKLHKAFTV